MFPWQIIADLTHVYFISSAENDLTSKWLSYLQAFSHLFRIFLSREFAPLYEIIPPWNSLLDEYFCAQNFERRVKSFRGG